MNLALTTQFQILQENFIPLDRQIYLRILGIQNTERSRKLYSFFFLFETYMLFFLH
jgi:hypothetical protein